MAADYVGMEVDEVVEEHARPTVGVISIKLNPKPKSPTCPTNFEVGGSSCRSSNMSREESPLRNVATVVRMDIGKGKEVVEDNGEREGYTRCYK